MFFNFFARFKSPLLECRLKMVTKLLLRSCPFSVLKVDWAEPAAEGSRNFPAVLVSRSTIKNSTRIRDNFTSGIVVKLRLELVKKPFGALKD